MVQELKKEKEQEEEKKKIRENYKEVAR